MPEEIEIRNFDDLEKFSRARPEEAQALVEEWNHFAKNHPEVASFTTAEQFYKYAKDNPGFQINTEIWRGNELSNAASDFRYPQETLTEDGQEKLRHAPLPTNLAGLAVLPFVRENHGVLEEDKDFLKTKGALEKEWMEKNPGKDFSAKEWLDYRYGDLDKAEASSFDEELERRFRKAHEKKWKAYEKKKDKTYDSNQKDEVARTKELFEKDHALTQVNKALEEHSLNRYKFLDRTDSEENWGKAQDKIKQYHWQKFAQKYPQKATYYAEKYAKELPDLKRAVETIRTKEALKKQGKDIRYQEKKHDENQNQQPQQITEKDIQELQRRNQQLINRLNQLHQRAVQAPSQISQAPNQARAALQNRLPQVGNLPERLAGNLMNRTEQFGERVAQRLGTKAVTTIVRAFFAAGWEVLVVILLIILIIILIVVLFTPGEGGNIGGGVTQGDIPIPGLTLTKTGPPDGRVENGQEINYQIKVDYDTSVYTAVPLDTITLYDQVPQNTDFVSATGNYTLNAQKNLVSWPLKDSANFPQVRLVVKPKDNDSYVVNQAYASSPLGGSNACTGPYEGRDPYCTVEKLQPFFGANAVAASLICEAESSGDRYAFNPNCKTNDYSVGLFQINLVAHCPGAFSGDYCGRKIIDQAKLSACEARFYDPEENIKYAVTLSNGTDWTQWGTWKNGVKGRPSVQNILKSCGIIK